MGTQIERIRLILTDFLSINPILHFMNNSTFIKYWIFFGLIGIMTNCQKAKINPNDKGFGLDLTKKLIC